MSWSNKRQTTREEDIAYCLLGIFDVDLTPRYGEGKERASSRLQRKIQKHGESQPEPSIQAADAHIRHKHYTEERLKIQRLLGKLLPMEQCYIKYMSFVDHESVDRGSCLS